jgi:hypothetical protein
VKRSRVFVFDLDGSLFSRGNERGIEVVNVAPALTRLPAGDGMETSQRLVLSNFFERQQHGVYKRTDKDLAQKETYRPIQAASFRAPFLKP